MSNGSESDVDPALVLNEAALSDVFPIELVEPDVGPFEGYADPEQRVANVHWHGEGVSHWHFQPVRVPLGGTRRVRTRFVDRGEQELRLGDGGAYVQSVRPTEEASGELVSITVDGAHVTLSGESAETGRLVFRLHDAEDETALWTSPELEIEVTE